MIFHSLLALVLLSPLPYASNRPWSSNLCLFIAFLLSLSWAIQYLLQPKKTVFFPSVKALSDIIIAFFSVLIWLYLQQKNAFLPDLSHPLWHIVDESFNNSINYISLTVTDTFDFILRYLSYAVVFWLALCYAKDISYARKIIYSFMTASFCYALYGLIMLLGGFHFVLFETALNQTAIFSTFINYDHYATFAGLGLLTSTALLYEGIIKSLRYRTSDSNMALQLFLENLIMRAWFPLLSFIILSTALILTHSRGGFFSTILALIVFISVLNINPKTRNKKMFSFFIIGIILSSIIFYISSAGLLDKINQQGLTDAFRERVYESTWSAINTNPWLGFGAGSFTEVFTLYKSLDIAGSIAHPILWDYAHNVYLETFFELGIPASCLLFYCFFRLAWLCVRGLFIRHKDWFYSALGLSATVLIAVHSTVDFSLQMPAVAYSYFLLMGAAVAQSFPSRSRKK